VAFENHELYTECLGTETIGVMEQDYKASDVLTETWGERSFALVWPRREELMKDHRAARRKKAAHGGRDPTVRTCGQARKLLHQKSSLLA